MRDSKQADTTEPLSTTAAESEHTRLAMRWVHPTPRPDTLLSPGICLGRGDDCDVVLEGTNTSRRHARVIRRGAALLLEDLGSRNGTHHDGERVTLAPLEPAAVVRLGEWVGVVVRNPGSGRTSELAPGLFGSERLEECVRTAQAAAKSRLSILITGETGTGKELLARAVHSWSARPGPLVALNCAAFADSLLEAELFGHERGAFTGAVARRDGLVREAHGGTLFLDEVGELSAAAQAKLLRVLEQREVLPVGGNRQLQVDLRVISATHRDLEQQIERGSFRRDLHARLNGVRLELPTLRARREDVVPLFARFVCERLGRRPQLSARFAEALCSYAWPSNVRELEQAAERLCVLAGADSEWHRRHLLSALPAAALEPAPFEPVSPPSRTRPSALSRGQIVLALEAQRGNLTQAAQQLGIARETLYRLLRVHSIPLGELRPGRVGQEPAT